jgi:hypothetical protein
LLLYGKKEKKLKRKKGKEDDHSPLHRYKIEPCEVGMSEAQNVFPWDSYLEKVL